MNYAADSVRVRRISPKPTATMTLAAATQAGMLSLRGTGSMERVQVDCPVGEMWEITVGNSLGVVSAQDDIQGALDHYAAPPVTGVLSELDALESELRTPPAVRVPSPLALRCRSAARYAGRCRMPKTRKS